MVLKIEGKTIGEFFNLQTKIKTVFFKKTIKEEGSALIGILVVEYFKDDHVKVAGFEIKGVKPFPPALFSGTPSPDPEDYEWVLEFAKSLWEAFGKIALTNTVADWARSGLDPSASVFTFLPSQIEHCLKE